MKDSEWKDEYLLGIPAVDLQHKRIFDCFVTIAEESSAKHDRWLADSSFAQLVGLLQQHFALEESMMPAAVRRGVREEGRPWRPPIRAIAQPSPAVKEDKAQMKSD